MIAHRQHGVHPPAQKQLTAARAVEILPTPGQVRVPLAQHIGAPCKPVVRPRQEVSLGEVVGGAEAHVSASVHATISGIAAKLTMTTLPNGQHVPAIPIKATGYQLEGRELWNEIYGGHWTDHYIDQYSPEEIVEAVREAGIVGLGGAAFPTHVKLKPNGKRIDTVVINGCECEPYLTADYRLMLEAPAPIVVGALLIARVVGAGRIIIAIEDNKPAAIQTMAVSAHGTGISVAAVETKYPMGSERSLIPAVLGRDVPTGGLPLDVGVVVSNVATSAAVARAVLRGKPLTHRIVTVSGAGVLMPKNLLAPIGTSYAEILSYCGGMTDNAARVISGGPMMGFTVGDLETPVTKGTSGITVLTRDDIRQADETPCLHCGRCVDVCPLNLVPTKIALAARHGDWELAQRHHIAACVECGCCTYACPARIPLVHLIRTGKAVLRRGQAA